MQPLLLKRYRELEEARTFNNWLGKRRQAQERRYSPRTILVGNLEHTTRSNARLDSWGSKSLCFPAPSTHPAKVPKYLHSSPGAGKRNPSGEAESFN